MITILSDRDFLTKVEQFTSSQLQKRDDVGFIIEEIVRNGKEVEFENLIFTAKYISGLLRVIKKAPAIPEVNNIDNMRMDLNENMIKVIDQMKEILVQSNPDKQEFFNRNYFTLSQTNFSNLSQLFSDLESVKKYLNHLKRQS